MTQRRGNYEGTIHQLPSGSYRAQICINGKRQSFTHKERKHVQGWVRQKQQEVDRGYDPQRAEQTLDTYFEDWYPRASQSLKQNTARQYRANYQRFVQPTLGSRALNQLNLRQMEGFYSQMGQQGHSPYVIRYVHRILHKMFEDALRYDILLRNPVHRARLPGLPYKEMRILEESQVSRFLLAARTSSLEALYHLALVTGMRQGELLGLQWTDIHWQLGEVHVQRQLKHNPGQGWYLDQPKTRAGIRTIRVGENSLQVLREHKQRQVFQAELAADLWQEHNLIFTSQVGTPLDRSNLLKDFRRVLQLANLPTMRFHDLRHTAASLMLNHNISVMVVCSMLGHSRPSVTMDIYGHLITSAQSKAAQLMDELVSPVAVSLPGMQEGADKLHTITHEKEQEWA
jgi:integrase